MKENKEMKAFICPSCKHALPSKELFSFRKNHITICRHCSSHLEPVNGKSFYWGFVLGFIGFLIPAELLKLFFDSLLLSFVGGLFGGLFTILLVALFIRKRTFFKIKYLGSW